jgi:hypothetical protein
VDQYAIWAQWPAVVEQSKIGDPAAWGLNVGRRFCS